EAIDQEDCIMSLNLANLSSFFFQAEDGIRDLYVTGVQTCALPIYHDAFVTLGRGVELVDRVGGGLDRGIEAERRDGATDVVVDRSEERRVGKEGRSRWSPYH